MAIMWNVNYVISVNIIDWSVAIRAVSLEAEKETDCEQFTIAEQSCKRLTQVL